MSHSRKDKVGGHAKREICTDAYRDGTPNTFTSVWGESAKRYAKRFRSKMARRHARHSLRDLLVIEPYDPWQEMEDHYNEQYGDFHEIEFGWYNEDQDYEYPSDDHYYSSGDDYVDDYPYERDVYYDDYDLYWYESYARETDYERGYREGRQSALDEQRHSSLPYGKSLGEILADLQNQS